MTLVLRPFSLEAHLKFQDLWSEESFPDPPTHFAINFGDDGTRAALVEGLSIGCYDRNVQNKRRLNLAPDVAVSSHGLQENHLLLQINQHGVLCFKAVACPITYSSDGIDWNELPVGEPRAVMYTETRLRINDRLGYLLEYRTRPADRTPLFMDIARMKMRFLSLVHFTPSELTQTYRGSGVCVDNVTLSSGGDGRVSRAFGRGGEALAVKERLTRNLATHDAAVREFRIARSFRGSDNVMAAVDGWCEHDRLLLSGGEACEDCHGPGRILISFPLAAGTMLDFAASLADLSVLPEVLRQIAQGLKQIHSLHIAHRDISPKNILVVDNGSRLELRIADFGRAIDDQLEPPPWKSTALGPKSLLAPEVGRSEGYDGSIDLWGMGLVTVMLLCKVPWIIDNQRVTEEALGRCLRQLHHSLRSKDGLSKLHTVLRRLLSWEPADRPSATETVLILEDVAYKE